MCFAICYRILEYTRETLKQFKVQYDLKQKQAKTGGGSGGGDGGGFGFGFGGGDSGGAPPPAEKQVGWVVIVDVGGAILFLHCKIMRARIFDQSHVFWLWK